ncbi:hypothetical protein BKA56DRAFT_212686 [Ilyonectria sp. MPI-CAGE-AT-0026]|nr:hypothetical protein BKA56DRAFT_212686 [Ilyonectria sp. MPI-CAGE-AT-0026]
MAQVQKKTGLLLHHTTPPDLLSPQHRSGILHLFLLCFLFRPGGQLHSLSPPCQTSSSSFVLGAGLSCARISRLNPTHHQPTQTEHPTLPKLLTTLLFGFVLPTFGPAARTNRISGKHARRDLAPHAHTNTRSLDSGLLTRLSLCSSLARCSAIHPFFSSSSRVVAFLWETRTKHHNPFVLRNTIAYPLANTRSFTCNSHSVHQNTSLHNSLNASSCARHKSLSEPPEDPHLSSHIHRTHNQKTLAFSQFPPLFFPDTLFTPRRT